jgi:DNA-binding CsgD family transcriptional regulator
MPTAIENFDIWMKVESNVHSIYPNFLHNLATKHGKLSEYEIRICMLTLLKQSPLEIAEIMQLKDVHAIHMASSRLHEKFGVTGEALVVYLLKLADS